MFNKFKKYFDSLIKPNEENLIELPFEIKKIFEIFKNLVNHSLMDFSIIKLITNKIIDEFNKLNNNKIEQEKLINNFIFEMNKFTNEIYSKFKKIKSFQSYYNLVLIILSFYLFVFNMENNEFFYSILFSENNILLNNILTIIINIKDEFIKEEIYLLTMYFLFDSDMIKKMEKMNLLEKLQSYQFKLKEINIRVTLSTLKENTNKFRNLLIFLKKCDFDYSKFEEKYKFEDKKIIRSLFSQSLVRIITNPLIIKIKPNEHNFICDFIQILENKSAYFYFNKYGNNLMMLYRNDLIFDDVLKNFCFIFGGEFYVKYFNPVLNYLINMEFNENSNVEYAEIFYKFINDLENLPKIILCILKIIQIEIQKIFSIEIDNYLAIFFYLFLSYFLNPIFEEIFNPGISKNKKLFEVNKIIMSICCGEKFTEKFNKNLMFLNDFVDVFNKRLSKKIIDLTNEINSNDIEKIVKNDMEKLNIKVPYEFFIIFDCTILIKFCMQKD